MARQVQITFDCVDPHRLAAWWATQLGLLVEDHDAVVRELLRSSAIDESAVIVVDDRHRFADAAAASDPTGSSPRFYFQRVPESKTAKNRIHLDVGVGDANLEDEVARWTTAGAVFVSFGEHPGHRWAVMADPEGNEFCLH